MAFPAVVRRGRRPWFDGLRGGFRVVRGAGLAAQQRLALPGAHGFPGHLPCLSTTVSTLCCFGQLLRCLESTVVGADGVVDRHRLAEGKGSSGLPQSQSCGLYTNDKVGQVSGNRQGPTMIQPRRPWKSNFRCKPCSHLVAADWQTGARTSQPCPAMRRPWGRQRRRWRCDLIRHQRGTFTAFAMRHRHRSIRLDSTCMPCSFCMCAN